MNILADTMSTFHRPVSHKREIPSGGGHPFIGEQGDVAIWILGFSPGHGTGLVCVALLVYDEVLGYLVHKAALIFTYP